MLTLFYGPGACSMAAHIVLEESGQKYEPKRMDLAKGEQRSADYMKIHPLGRVPALKLDDGAPLSENTAILPYLGKRFNLWTNDPTQEVKMMSFIGWVASSVHPAQAHIGRPERYASDPATFDNIKETIRRTARLEFKMVDDEADFFGKVDDILADGDSGTVAQDVDLAPFLNGGFDGPAAIGCAAHITVERKRVAVLILNFGDGVASLRFIDFEHGD